MIEVPAGRATWVFSLRVAAAGLRLGLGHSNFFADSNGLLSDAATAGSSLGIVHSGLRLGLCLMLYVLLSSLLGDGLLLLCLGGTGVVSGS